MNNDKLTQEHRILITLRQVLSAIARETTPPPGMQHPLSSKTIEDIKNCFMLLAAREKELNEQHGHDTSARPRFIDEPKTSHVVPFTKPEKK